MSNTTIVNMAAEDATPQQMAAWQAQLDALHPQRALEGKHTVASKAEVVMQGGKVAHLTEQAKTQGYNEAYVNQPKPGFVTIGGVETPVAAAKAAGLLPAHWQEGQTTPFGEPAAAPEGTKAGTRDADADKGPEDVSAKTAHQQHLAKIAGDILHGVDQLHGPQVADALMNQVAESGDVDEIMGQLPQGVNETHVKQVMAGYVAAADAAFAKAGSSLTAVEELLDEDQLREARRLTMVGNSEGLQDLGRIALDRLAQLPEKDPEAFRDMLDAMPSAQRKMIVQTADKRGWMLKAPGHPEMSFGAAVRAGFIRL